MTERKAIEILEYIKSFNTNDSPLTEAIEIAIGAIKFQSWDRASLMKASMVVAKCPFCENPIEIGQESRIKVKRRAMMEMR